MLGKNMALYLRTWFQQIYVQKLMIKKVQKQILAGKVQGPFNSKPFTVLNVGFV